MKRKRSFPLSCCLISLLWMSLTENTINDIKIFFLKCSAVKRFALSFMVQLFSIESYFSSKQFWPRPKVYELLMSHKTMKGQDMY